MIAKNPIPGYAFSQGFRLQETAKAKNPRQFFGEGFIETDTTFHSVSLGGFLFLLYFVLSGIALVLVR
jgi:hypothetical protein